MQLKDVTPIIKAILEERDKIPRIIDKERYIPNPQPYHDGDCMRGGIRKALRIIEQAPVVDAIPRWISVEERLPDMGVKVLLLYPHMCEWDDSPSTVECIVVTGELCTAFGCKKKKAWNVHRNAYDLGEYRDLSYATHWMTIPTLPQLPEEVPYA